MRLTDRQTRIIGDTVRAALGPRARVWLFGSRVDDAERGGDIDLLVDVDRPLANRAAAASRLAAELQLALGDQRIDVIVVDPHTAPQPIHTRARRQGVRL
jgi:predicted nucleotidyltransferase